ncbi:hypothetical protein NQZ68_038797, partial [Dissostichus eleginoides]
YQSPSSTTTDRGGDRKRWHRFRFSPCQSSGRGTANVVKLVENESRVKLQRENRRQNIQQSD